MSKLEDLSVGQVVRISGGLLKGTHGVVACFREQEVVVTLEESGAGAYVQFSPELLEPLQ